MAYLVFLKLGRHKDIYKYDILIQRPKRGASGTLRGLFARG